MEILNRHATLDSQIASLGLTTVDVQGDGNCLFRSVSFVLFGHENNNNNNNNKVFIKTCKHTEQST